MMKALKRFRESRVFDFSSQNSLFFSNLNPKLEICVTVKWADCLCTYVVVEQIHLRYKYIFTYIFYPEAHRHTFRVFALFVFIFSYRKLISERSFINSQWLGILSRRKQWRTYRVEPGIERPRRDYKVCGTRIAYWFQLPRNCLHSLPESWSLIATGAGHAKIL